MIIKLLNNDKKVKIEEKKRKRRRELEVHTNFHS